jgi:hypothetical protein
VPHKKTILVVATPRSCVETRSVQRAITFITHRLATTRTPSKPVVHATSRPKPRRRDVVISARPSSPSTHRHRLARHARRPIAAHSHRIPSHRHAAEASHSSFSHSLSTSANSSANSVPPSAKKTCETVRFRAQPFANTDRLGIKYLSGFPAISE